MSIESLKGTIFDKPQVFIALNALLWQSITDHEPDGRVFMITRQLQSFIADLAHSY
jgi:hypothetical protein